jgi:hypothetical protein
MKKKSLKSLLPTVPMLAISVCLPFPGLAISSVEISPFPCGNKPYRLKVSMSSRQRDRDVKL